MLLQCCWWLNSSEGGRFLRHPADPGKLLQMVWTSYLASVSVPIGWEGFCSPARPSSSLSDIPAAFSTKIRFWKPIEEKRTVCPEGWAAPTGLEDKNQPFFYLEKHVISDINLLWLVSICLFLFLNTALEPSYNTLWGTRKRKQQLWTMGVGCCFNQLLHF